MDQDEEDPESPKDVISPNGDVFSYFQLTAPSELKIHGHFTVDAFMSYALVAVVLFIQGVLLYCVQDKILTTNLSWIHNVMNTGEDWNLASAAYNNNKSGCNDGKSLCNLDPHTGTFSCAPPSVQLIGRWNELDTNGDGVWTYDEMLKSRDEIKCKYVVDPVEFYDVIVLLLKERKKFISLHPDVINGVAITKDYFTYIMGDVAMCGYRDADMCGNLVKRGVFDAAIKYGTVPRVGSTVVSALDYCHSLLDQGAFCERVLPSTYATWKIESVQECKAPKFHQFVYKDPHGSLKSLLAVDYKARVRYETAQTTIFKVYKICIIFLWTLLNVHYLREVVKQLSWVSQIPAANEEQLNEHNRKSAEAKAMSRKRSELYNDEIHTLGKHHRIALWVVTLARICILCVLGFVGLNFLARQTDYIGLLLDGVALMFIVEVESLIYERVLRQDRRTDWEGREPIELKKLGHRWLSQRPDVMDMVWLFIVAFFSIVFLLYYTSTVVAPLYSALECACLNEGEKCQEAQTFSYDFWYQYWRYDVPNSIQAIKTMNGGLPLNDLRHAVTGPVPAPAASMLSFAARAGRAAGSIMQHQLDVDGTSYFDAASLD